MPQMAPLSWLTLMFIFSLFIIFTSNKIWFSTPMFNDTTISINNKLNKSLLNSYLWKW